MKHIYFTLLFSLLLFERVSIAQEEEPIAPTVSTDKEDYLPGEYVIVKGTGWQPGETVSLHFEEEPKRCSNDHIRTTVADASGNIYYDQFLINDYHKGVFFHLTASEANTGKWAETWFTDGMITVTTNMLWSQLDDPDIAGFQPPSGNDVITVKTGAILTVNVSNAVASSVNLAGGNPDRGSGTLKFNSGSKLTVNGPVSMGASVYVSYGWPRSGGYTVEYNGVIDMTAGGTLVTTILDPRYYWPCSYCSPSSLGTLISGTGTIEITGSATLPSGNSFATYNNLIISSSGSVSTSNAFQTTINSNLTINGSLSLQGQLNIKGNLTFGSAGILNTSTHNITFNGSSNQAISKSGGAVIPLYDLTVSKSSGVLNISNDITISNVLRLNQGNVSTSLRKVYVSNSFPSSVIRSNGYINGNLERAVGIGSGNYLFPIGTSSSYAPATISMNNVTTAGRLLARTNDGDHAEISTSTSLDPSNSVNRNWAITNSGAEFSDYGISLNFVASDKDPGLNTDTFILGKIDNGEWSYPNVITRTPTSISANGMTSFSSFVAANSLVSEDLVAPVLTVETLTPFTAQCLVNFSDLTIPTAMDNVDGTIQGTTNQSIFPITQQGSYTITWTYTDTAGNSSTQNQTIIVDDTTAPVPALAQLPVVSGQCSVTVTAPTAIDACEGTITGTTTDPTSYTAQGAYTITWTYDDGNGNTSTQIQTVIVDDTAAPVPALAELPTISGQCSATVTAPTANDACAGTITGTTTDPTSYTEQGTYTITWTYDDGNGNTSTQTQTVTVDDTTAPVPGLAELPTISGQCSATVTAPTANDACAGTIMGTTTDPLTYDAQGTYTITWTYTDAAGNSSTQNQTIIVDDTTAPIPSVAQLPAVSAQCSVTVTPPTANDACAGTITGTTTDPLNYDAQGTYTITWTYDDGNGNTSTQTQTVIVDDTTAPVPTVAQLPIINGQCSATVTAPTANDACEGTITGTTTDPTSYTEQGNYTITWTYDDGNGNTSTQTQTVIVDDTTAPVPAVSQLAVVSGQCSVEVSAPKATDACEGEITGTTTDQTSFTEQGTYTITWTYDDGNGNSVTQEQTVIVDDTTAPVPAVTELPEISGQCAVTVTAPTANDACAGTITGTTSDPLTYDAQGTYTITWTYDDGNGNTSTQTQTVIVDDTTAPVPALAQLPVASGQCSVSVTAPTANDACEGTITGTTTDPLTYSTQGTYTINWRYDDGNGNSVTQQQTVIVNDTTIPTWSTAAGSLNRTISCGQNELLAQALLLTPVAGDNCSVMSVEKTAGAFVPFGPNGAGTITNTWVAFDVAGNESEVFTQVITVEGIQIDASASSTPVQLGSTATLSASVTPAVAGVSVKFYLDDVLRGTSITNSGGTATLSVSGLALDVYKVTAIVGSGCAESIAYLPVYDPNGNFVTGGGWINSPGGALIGTTTVGKANFGFVSKYKKGSNQVDGNTEFQFSAGNLSFKSTLHEAGTLVISGRKATYRGEGTVNGISGYKFTITAIDGHWNGGTGPDQFRIKIWGSNGVLYDNGLGADDNSDIATSLGGGSIVIHETKARGTKRVVIDLITVPWNTSAETIKQKVDQMSTAWFESRKQEMALDTNSYDPLTPGFYELKADLVENEFFKLDEPISIQVLVQDKPKALDIELSSKSISKQMKAGDQIGTLNTMDPVDNIHTYRIEGNPNLAVEGNRLIWKGIGMPEAQMKLTVFSTDRAGQTISKEITLFRELRIGEFLIYPNPAEDRTNVLVELDKPSQVSLSVYDAVGRMVISDQFTREETFVQTLDVSGLAPGMYTVQIQVGKMVMTGRLIKK